MGTAQSIDRIGDDRNVPDSRKVFSAFESYRVITSARLRAHVVYTIKLRYQRFAWFIHRRFNDFYTLDADLRSIDPDLMFSQPKPKKFSRLMTSHSDPAFCSQRGVYLGSYLQMIMDLFGERIMTTKVLQAFLEIGSVRCHNMICYEHTHCANTSLILLLIQLKVSFSPELGRKGREGILKKVSHKLANYYLYISDIYCSVCVFAFNTMYNSVLGRLPRQVLAVVRRLLQGVGQALRRGQGLRHHLLQEQRRRHAPGSPAHR